MKRTVVSKFAFVILIVFISCKSNPLKVDISKIKNEIKIVRFEKELFALTKTDSLQPVVELREKYPGFFDVFTYKIIQIGGIDDTLFMAGLNQFLTDSMILSVKSETEKRFSDFEPIENEFVKAFKYYQFHFPDKKLPVVYTFISGFNHSVVTAENIIGIGLDKYLGRDCEWYQKLNSTPQYKILNMHPGKIVPDAVYAWGMTEFNNNSNATTLLDHMIYQGKLMYFTDALLPDTPDSLKIGFTQKQLKWCKMNEAEMWGNLIENKLLYSNKRMDIVRYINAAPSTSGFPSESPGRTGVWLGWQIVRRYMQKFPETSLPALMQNTDYQQILNDSKYFPD